MAVHAEDRAMLAANEGKLKQAKKVGAIDFLRAHTETVELKAIQRLLKHAKAQTCNCISAMLPAKKA